MSSKLPEEGKEAELAYHMSDVDFGATSSRTKVLALNSFVSAPVDDLLGFLVPQADLSDLDSCSVKAIGRVKLKNPDGQFLIKAGQSRDKLLCQSRG